MGWTILKPLLVLKVRLGLQMCYAPLNPHAGDLEGRKFVLFVAIHATNSTK